MATCPKYIRPEQVFIRIFPNWKQAITFEILIFVCVGIWVVFLVSSNLTRPFKNIIQVLHNIKKGNFTSRVKVTSNDEIGYTGDTINEMTQGLMERDRIQQSLSMAKEIQQNLVPRKNIKANGLDMAGRSVYCDETGGDYYDFIPMGARVTPKQAWPSVMCPATAYRRHCSWPRCGHLCGNAHPCREGSRK